MKNKIIYKNFIPKKYLNKKYSKQIDKKYKKVIANLIQNFKYEKDATHSLSKDFKFSFNENHLRKFKKFKIVVVVGMGGSTLGSQAIYYSLKDKINKKFIFFDNLDENKIKSFKKDYTLDKILFLIISKSGNTIETISNLVTLKILKKNKKNIIIISEKKNNGLYLISKKMNLFHIEHKDYISGRFSVFSEVGMIPAYLMGINLKSFKKNLLNNLKIQNNKFLKESSKKMANIIKGKKFKNIIFLNYIPSLDKFLYWNQQLLAESLGKNRMGFLPVVSTAPRDHHSLLQLFLDGPQDKLFYIFSINFKKKTKLNTTVFGKFFKFLNNKSLGKIKDSQKNALLIKLKKKNIPYREFKINNSNYQIIGQLFSYFMLETILIAKLINLDPFDQPAIEQVKINTKKLLS